jgi:hypothetical protein
MMKYGLRSRSKTFKGHPPDKEKVFDRRNPKQERGTSCQRQRQQRVVQRPANAAQISFAKYGLLRDQNQTPTTISNEVKVRRSARLLGKAKVMSYDEREKGATKEAIKGKGKFGRKRKYEPKLELEPKLEVARMTAPVARMI